MRAVLTRVKSASVTVDGKTMLSGSRMTIIAGVFSVMAIICYLLCFKMVQERVQLTTKSEKMDFGKLVKSIATNRSLMGIIAAALFLGIFLYSIKKRDVKPQYETLGK